MLVHYSRHFDTPLDSRRDSSNASLDSTRLDGEVTKPGKKNNSGTKVV